MHTHTGFFRSGALLALAASAVLSTSCHRESSNREVWAEVDGKPIYRDEVEDRYRHGRNPAANSEDDAQALSLKLNVLNELIDNQVLLERARQAQISVSEAEVDKKIGEFRSPYTAEQFTAKLKEQGLTLAELSDEVRQSLTIDKLINKEVTSRVAVTNADIEAYYEQHKSSFNVADNQYHLAQILVTPGAAPQATNAKRDDAIGPENARRKADKLYAQLKAGGNFASLAGEYSEDPRTASGGGDMGFVPASVINSDVHLRQAIASLTVGKFTPPIRDTTGNYHIIMLLGTEKAGQHDLNDPQVESSIRKTLMDQKEQLLKAAYIEDLRNRAKVMDYLAQKIVQAAGQPSAVK